VVQRCANLDIIWEPTQIGDVVLHASHVWEDPKDAADVTLNGSNVNILVAHHLLTNKKTIFDTVNTGDFAQWMRDGDAPYNMVLSGDLHDGYDVHEVDGMWFCNPGSSAAEIMRERNDFDPTAFVKEVEEFEVESADVHELVQKVGRAKGIRKDVLDYIAEKSGKIA
jgi:hypothetical protein